MHCQRLKQPPPWLETAKQASELAETTQSVTDESDAAALAEAIVSNECA